MSALSGALQDDQQGVEWGLNIFHLWQQQSQPRSRSVSRKMLIACQGEGSNSGRWADKISRIIAVSVPDPAELLNRAPDLRSNMPGLSCPKPCFTASTSRHRFRPDGPWQQHQAKEGRSLAHALHQLPQPISVIRKR
ncbi:hypothetical protein RRG08_062341 [Elysia crispata]|uniref:Uncharacterized protein n=1 Tax=Elysia crispata TaxID=231223 RepID=A0AAE1CYY0_9GAST|nr:hypothetical protein RRG08_062341 [Elysia crispata]